MHQATKGPKHGKKGRIKQSGIPRARKRNSFLSRYPVGLLKWARYKRELKLDGKGFQINALRQSAARKILDKIWFFIEQYTVRLERYTSVHSEA